MSRFSTYRNQFCSLVAIVTSVVYKFESNFLPHSHNMVNLLVHFSLKIMLDIHYCKNTNIVLQYFFVARWLL